MLVLESSEDLSDVREDRRIGYHEVFVTLEDVLEDVGLTLHIEVEEGEEEVTVDETGGGEFRRVKGQLTVGVTLEEL